MLTYNAAAFVEEAIESVLAQVTDFPVELVIGDDCSTDGTQDLLRDYAARYPRGIRLHLHPTHGPGVAGRLNNMHNLADCRGRYIAILDGDDYWTDAGKLAAQAGFLETHPAHSSCSADGYVVVDGERVRTRLGAHARLVGRDMTLDYYAAYDVTAMIPSSLMFRRAWLLPLPPWFEEVVVADQYIKLMLLKRGPCRFLPGLTHAYRHHGDNFTATHLADARGALAEHDDGVRMRRLLPWLPYSDRIERRQLQRLRYAAAVGLRERRWRLLGAVLRRLPRYVRRRPLRWVWRAFFAPAGRPGRPVAS